MGSPNYVALRRAFRQYVERKQAVSPPAGWFEREWREFYGL